MSNQITRRVFRGISAVGLAVAASFASTAFAQETAEDDTKELETFEVTGSRITAAGYEASNPVATLDREALERTSAANLGELLQRLTTENAGAPLTTQTNNGGTGAVTIDLRGFQRTLVLINGRRIVDGGDFQTIPLIMVERIDILKTGASAIYGVDAVAGVVNVITRSDYTGSSFTASRQSHSNVDGGANNTTVGGIIGTATGAGYGNFGFEHRRQEAALQGDFGQGFLNEGRLVIDPDAFNGDPFGPGTVFFGSSRIPEGVFQLESDPGTPLSTRPGTNGRDPATDFFEPDLGLFSPDNDLYNFAPANYLQTPFETNNFFANAGFDLGGGTEVYFEGRFSNRTSEQLLAPVPFDTLFDPAFTLPDGTQGISEDNVYNPFGENIVRVRRRIVEGSRSFTQNVDQLQGVIGFRGSLPVAGFWNYDTHFSYGRRVQTDIDRGQLLGSRLQLALGPSFDAADNDPNADANGDGNPIDQPTCGTPSDPIAGCVPLNFFGGPGSITAEQLDYVSRAAVDRFEFEQMYLNASIDGTIMNLPAGPWGVAFGAEVREESNLSTPDSSKSVGAISGNVFQQIGGKQDITSFFAEMSIPILSGVRGAEDLSVRAAFRRDDFESELNPLVGRASVSKFDNDSLEFGVRWQPVEDLLVRATFAEVFTAPSIGQLFSPLFDSFPQVADPCSADNFGNLSPAEQQACQNQGVPAGGVVNPDPQPRVRLGGNPELGPESGDTFTAGFVLSPRQVPGLSITADYWEIDLEDAIDTVPAEDILQACLDEGGTGPSCGLVDRSSPTNEGEIVRILSNAQNLARETGRGLDMGIEYEFTTGFVPGAFEVGTSWSRLLERDRTILNSTAERAGKFTTDDEGFPENKINSFVSWKGQFVQVDYFAQYVGKMDAPYLFVPGEQEIDSQLYHDVKLSYSAPFGIELDFVIENVTDELPPFIDQAFNGNVDEVNHRIFGRSFTLGVSRDF